MRDIRGKDLFLSSQTHSLVFLSVWRGCRQSAAAPCIVGRSPGGKIFSKHIPGNFFSEHDITSLNLIDYHGATLRSELPRVAGRLFPVQRALR